MAFSEEVTFYQTKPRTVLFSSATIILLVLAVVWFGNLTVPIPWPYRNHIPATMFAFAFGLSASAYEDRLWRRVLASAVVAACGYLMAPLFPIIMISGIILVAALLGSFGGVKLPLTARLLTKVVRAFVGVGGFAMCVACFPSGYIGTYGEGLIEAPFPFLLVVCVPIILLFASDTLLLRVATRQIEHPRECHDEGGH